MFMCLIYYISKGNTGELDILPFSLLKIYHRVRKKASMSSAGTCTNSGGVQIFSVAFIDIVYCPVIIAL